MKEIIAIIRPKKVGPTRNALDQLGFPSMTATAVLGRGLQRGVAGEINLDCPSEALSQASSGGMKYIPKRLLSVAVRDTDVDVVVNVILHINRTGKIGDGKIFVCPLDDSLRVRTGERGEDALS